MGTTQLKVGLLVLAALVVFMATIFSLGQQEHLWERKVEYEIHFARAGGLLVGAGVSLAGVPVGSVASMRFPEDPSVSYIQVGIKVGGDVAVRVRENSVASIRTLGLLGDRYIELTAGTPDAPTLAPGSVINAIDPVDYEAVLGQSGDIVTNVVEVTASLKTVLSPSSTGRVCSGPWCATASSARPRCATSRRPCRTSKRRRMRSTTSCSGCAAVRAWSAASRRIRRRTRP